MYGTFFSYTGESIVNEDTMLKLVQSVSAMEAKIEGMSENLSELKSDIALLKQSQMDESRENTKFMKLTWVALGACVGAGGTEAVKAFVVAMGGM